MACEVRVPTKLGAVPPPYPEFSKPTVQPIEKGNWVKCPHPLSPALQEKPVPALSRRESAVPVCTYGTVLDVDFEE